MKTYFVDAFTKVKFKGNPAAVCLVENTLDDSTMQSIATEIGFSETAFISPIDLHQFDILYFSPKEEIPLCGHATLSAAKVLFDQHGMDQLRFYTRSKLELNVFKISDQIMMEFPIYPLRNWQLSPGALEALGNPSYASIQYAEALNIVLVEMDDFAALQALNPDFSALVHHCPGVRGICVSSRFDGPEFDFSYRFFWPWSGTNEDPVTGGVQTFLAPFWAAKLGRNQLKALQCSLRTGEMEVHVSDEKVQIFGEGVIVLEGTFQLP